MAAATLSAQWWPFLAGHVTASIGLALMMTPAFTGGLGALPRSLYSYGSALLGTVQQVGAAVGTAVAIAVLSWRQGALLDGGAAAQDALDGGVRASLLVGVGLGVLVVVISTFVRTAPGTEVTEGPAATEDDATDTEVVPARA
jgi:DHA2 family lincomycin resistance protein-like MFS transporter